MSKIDSILYAFPMFLIFNVFSAADWTITTSGTYTLNDDISASVGDATKGTINIASSYVTLDLAGRFIAQRSSGGTAGAIGIVVNSGVTDVVIKNGTIRSFLQSGVRINSNNSRIFLQNLIIESCAVRGIELQGASGSTIQSSEIKNCRIFNCCSSASADTALQLLFTNGLLVENVILEANNPGSTGTFNTVLIDSCSYCSFNSVYVVNSTGAGSSSILRGFSLISNSAVVQSCILENCQFSNNINGSSGVVHGFYFNSPGSNLVSYNMLSNCLVSTNTGAGNFYGFYCSGSNCQTNVFDKCIVSGNSSTGGNVGGFEMDSSTTQNVFTECIAIGNTHTAASSTGTNLGGFKIEGTSTFNSMLRCIAADNVSTTSICAGFYIVSGSSNYIKQCQASKNTGNSDINSNGLRWDAGLNNIFCKNVASRDGSTASTTDIGGALPFPAGSQTSATSATMNTPTVPWSNLKIAS